MRVYVPADQIDHFRRRVIQDAMREATVSYWLRRAEVFERCLIQPDDYTGQLTPEQIQESNRRVQECADACRNHAWLIGGNI